jgi:ABC-type nitrate/sulfonate/bicarbonate transport system permease component
MMTKRTIAGTFLSIAALLLLWQIVSIGLDRYFLPTPSETLVTLAGPLREGKTWMHMIASFRRITL